MIKRVFILMLCLTSTALACGKGRWLIKTTVPKPAIVASATVSELSRIPRVPHLGAVTRKEQENTIYSVVAFLVGYVREADGDYHLVLQDTKNNATMVAEVPDPACTDNDVLAAKWKAARLFINQNYGSTTAKFKALNSKPLIRVTGVFFFDNDHGERGVAANAAELHPVIEISPAALTLRQRLNIF